ncbi:hypothetical protein PISMIDRAFT_102704, partial [Pisolithus microcarpus 441]
HQENIYFPWASRQEWVFASWLLQSCLSMAAMNSLLSLEIISLIVIQMKNVLLSFCSAKELRACAETLPPGPWWLCETLATEYPTKEPPHLFYHNPIECLQALLSHCYNMCSLFFFFSFPSPYLIFPYLISRSCLIFYLWTSLDHDVIVMSL